MANLRGIDVSEHNGNIDFRAAYRYLQQRYGGRPFCFIRATYGETDVDGMFGHARVNAARLAGFRVGFYHYAYPSGGDSVREAANFEHAIRSVGGLRRGDFLPVLDIEQKAAAVTNPLGWASGFEGKLQRDLGHECIIYTGNFWRENIHVVNGLNSPLWIAAYVEPRFLPRLIPLAWRAPRWGWAIWQDTSTGRVPGINGFVDMNQLKPEWLGRVTVA